MYVGKPGASLTGGLAVAVPSELAGLEMLWQRHGSGNISWRALVEPVAALAEDGFIADEELLDAIASHEEELRLFAQSSSIYLPGEK